MLTDDDRLDEIRERLADPIRSGFMRRLDQSDLSWCAAEIARLRAELDRRPDITPEDCAATILVCALTENATMWPGGHEAADRIANALRAHAQKAVRP